MHRRFSVLLLSLLCLMLLAMITTAQELPIPLPLEPDTAALHTRAEIELLTNGGFEINIDGDKIPDSWAGKKTDLIKKDKLKCTKNGKVFASSGDCAFMFRGNPDGSNSKLKQTITNTEMIVDGSMLTFSAYVAPRSAIPDSKIAVAKVKFSDSSKVKLQLKIPVSPVSGYILLTESAPVSIPGGVTITKAVVNLRYKETSGKFMIDDVSLTVPGIEAPPTHTPTSAPTLAPPTNTPAPDPTFKLLADDGESNDRFGNTVSLSADGSTALIGARLDDIGTEDNQGATYVFIRNGSGWVQQAKLTASDGESGDSFGFSISLSADGNTALIAAREDHVGTHEKQGSAYIFVRSGSTWTQQAKLTATDGASNDWFGQSVSLSADGNTALIGAYLDDVGAQVDQGSAYVFVRSDTTWTEQAKLLATDGETGKYFGESVSLSADGNTALIGMSAADIGTQAYQGTAYVFMRSSDIWFQQAKLIASDGENHDLFGWSVSLNADGNTALIGANADNIGTSYNQGSAYIFVRSGSTWTEQAKLITGNGANRFGQSVSLNSEGSTAVISAPWEDISAQTNQGSAYVFVRNGTTWSEQTKLTASDGAANDEFGWSVSLNADGSTVLIGVHRDDIGAQSDQGSAWVFELD